MEPFKSFFLSGREWLILKLSKIVIHHTAHKTNSTEEPLSVLQMTERHYETAIDLWTFCLFKQSSHYDEKISSYIAKLIKKVKMQMKVDFFNSKDPISTFRFLATFELV